MKLRTAFTSEAKECYQCIEDARVYHKSIGFVQWHPDYPTQKTIIDDIENGIGYVFEDGSVILGYCCIIFSDEPAYHVIEGKWQTDNPYAVIHRMAFSENARGRGLSKSAFALLRKFCLSSGMNAIRVDTQKENKVMQHILSREGFEYCGLITFDGGPKLAYEWDQRLFNEEEY